MKGISQIVVSVLLLAVALSVAGVYLKWAPNLAEETTGEATTQAENQIKCRNAGIYLKDVDYDISGQRAKATIENTGTIALYDDITVALINSSTITSSKKISELEVGEEQLVEIQSDVTPEKAVASSKECPKLKSSSESINVTE